MSLTMISLIFWAAFLGTTESGIARNQLQSLLSARGAPGVDTMLSLRHALGKRGDHFHSWLNRRHDVDEEGYFHETPGHIWTKDTTHYNLTHTELHIVMDALNLTMNDYMNDAHSEAVAAIDDIIITFKIEATEEINAIDNFTTSAVLEFEDMTQQVQAAEQHMHDDIMTRFQELIDAYHVSVQNLVEKLRDMQVARRSNGASRWEDPIHTNVNSMGGTVNLHIDTVIDAHDASVNDAVEQMRQNLEDARVQNEVVRNQTAEELKQQEAEFMSNLEEVRDALLIELDIRFEPLYDLCTSLREAFESQMEAYKVELGDKVQAFGV